MSLSPGGESGPRALFAATLIVTALIYSPSLRNEFVLDDQFQIVNNRFIGDWGREIEARDECATALAQAPNDPDARALMAPIERSGAMR